MHDLSQFVLDDLSNCLLGLMHKVPDERGQLVLPLWGIVVKPLKQCINRLPTNLNPQAIPYYASTLLKRCYVNEKEAKVLNFPFN